MFRLNIHVCTQMYNKWGQFFLVRKGGGGQIPLARSPIHLMDPPLVRSQRTTTLHKPRGNIGCQRLSIAKVENATVTGFSGVCWEQRGMNNHR